MKLYLMFARNEVIPPAAEWTQVQKDEYRFGGDRYSFRGTAHYGPDDIIPEIYGLYTFPKLNDDPS